MTNDDHRLTPEERGETHGPHRRLLLAGIVVVLIGAGVVGIGLAGRAEDTAVDPDAGASAEADDTAAPAPEDVVQSRLVGREDARVWRAVSRGPVPSVSDETLVVDRRDAGAYDVGDLVALGAAHRSRSVVTITRPVVVRTGATLVIHAPGATLRLASSRTRPVSLVAWGGALRLEGTARRPLDVVGWDAPSGRRDTRPEDGRAYVRAHAGSLVVDHVALDSLGFWSGRTGGVAVTGSTFDTGTATIRHSTIRRTHAGLYLLGTRDVRVARLAVDASETHGIELDRSVGTVLDRVRVDGAASTGILAHDRSPRLTIRHSRVADSGMRGIVVDGRAPATGPSSSGDTVVDAATLRISHTVVTRSRLGGIRVTATSRTRLTRVEVEEAKDAVTIVGPSSDTRIAGSTLTSSRRDSVQVEDGATEVVVDDSRLRGRASAVDVGLAEVDVLDNDIAVTRGSAVVATAGASGRVSGNTITGAGRTPLAMDGSSVREERNAVRDWNTIHPLLDWIEHNPFALLWLVILAVPAIGVNFWRRRRREQRELRQLVEDTITAMALSRRRAYAEERAPAGARVPAPRPPIVAPEPSPAPTAKEARQTATIRRGGMGQFRSPAELAVHAVLVAGREPRDVARTLQVDVSVVRAWVAASLVD